MAEFFKNLKGIVIYSSSAEADAFIASSIQTTTTTTTTTTISYLKPQTKSLLSPSLTAASFGEPLQYETIYDDIVS